MEGKAKRREGISCFSDPKRMQIDLQTPELQNKAKYFASKFLVNPLIFCFISEDFIQLYSVFRVIIYPCLEEITFETFQEEKLLQENEKNQQLNESKGAYRYIVKKFS